MAWEQTPGNDAGSMNGDGSRKLLLHTTEGGTVEGAIGAYRKNNSWPHLTVDCKRRRVVQHLPLTVAARSLRNTPGGADQTNRDGTILVQIEIIGSAVGPDIGDRDDLEWFGREVVGPICERHIIPLTAGVRWVSYPASFGTGAAQRLTPAAWDAYSGVLGHQHAPDNDHGDPGAIDIELILSAARGDDDMAMTAADRKALIDDIAQRVLERINEGYTKPNSVIRQKSRELAKLGATDAIQALAPDEPEEPADPSVPPTG